MKPTQPLSAATLASVLAVSLLAACAGIRFGASINECIGQMLIATEGPGADRLKVEMDYDSSVDHMVSQHGTPNYLLVESRLRLRLIYVVDDRVLLFERQRLQTRSSVSVVEPIPDDFARLFTRADQDKLAEVRRFRSLKNATPTPTPRAKARPRKKAPTRSPT